MYEILVKQAAERDDVTEQLKEFDKMKQVVRMKNIQNKAKEIVNTDLIYNYRTAVAEKFSLNPKKSLSVVSG